MLLYRNELHTSFTHNIIGFVATATKNVQLATWWAAFRFKPRNGDLNQHSEYEWWQLFFIVDKLMSNTKNQKLKKIVLNWLTGVTITTHVEAKLKLRLILSYLIEVTNTRINSGSFFYKPCQAGLSYWSFSSLVSKIHFFLDSLQKFNIFFQIITWQLSWYLEVLRAILQLLPLNLQ